jgi:hypothetical protein
MTDAPLQGAPGGTTAAPTRRQAYEARLKRRSNTIAIGSTLAVVLAVVVLVPLAPGWEAVKRSFFNAEVFAATFPGLLNAFMLDVAIFLWCAPLIALTGPPDRALPRRPLTRALPAAHVRRGSIPTSSGACR